MNIDGLSEATLQKFLDCGFIEELYDIYRIDRYETEIVKLEGFGQKSYDNMMESIEASRTTQLARVLYGLGILNVGTAMQNPSANISKMMWRQLSMPMQRSLPRLRRSAM